MAKYTGNSGDATFDANVIAEIQSWSVTSGVATAPSASKGDTWDEISIGRKNWSAEVVALFDDADTAQIAMVEGAAAACVFRAGGSGTPNWSGTGTITGFAIESPEDSAAECRATFSILGNGALAYSAT